MNRRDLLTKLAVGLPAVAITPIVSALELPKPQVRIPDEFMFHGWRCWWRDWVDMPNADVQVGVWIAYSIKWNLRHLYSAWPGAVGSFTAGGLFDISFQRDQVVPTRGTSEEDLRYFRSECLERLKRFIVQVGPPPLTVDAGYIR